jgi:hypothetical protein
MPEVAGRTADARLGSLRYTSSMRPILGGSPALELALIAIACTREPEEPAVECKLALEHLEPIDPASFALHVEAPDQNARRAGRDLAEYLGRMWGAAPLLAEGAPAFDRSHVVWVSTSTALRDALGASITEGFVLRRFDRGASRVVAVYAPDAANLAFGTYALLEEMGARFFHPMAEHVPELGGAYLPAVLDRTMTPAFRVRGVHLHLLHPIEWFDAFNGSSERDLEDAKRFVDWLVKTGQNHVQWPILRTMDLDAWSPHAKAIIAYAHERGVTTGVEPLLFARSSLQNNFVLATSDAWEAELDANVDFLESIGFDQIELALGEFLAEDPETVIDMLDRVVARSSTVSVVNHVGNFPNLWVDFRGEREFFYFLPAHADPRLIQSVHTVHFYDLYRPWGAYGHESFEMHRAFLLEQLAAGRTVRYKPESAYWVSADVDVPLFLPAYVHARWLDIHNLTRDVASAGLPPIDGHVLFSSGHEWGYWMTDYLAAKMMWEPDRPLDHFFDHAAAPYGTCAPRMRDASIRFTDLQSRYLFDRRLMPYLAGDDLHDDLGAAASFVTIPARIPFEAILAMDAGARARFRTEVIDGLEAFTAEAQSIEREVAATCAGGDAATAPWCNEILDGVAIVRLRAQHASALHRAVDVSRRAPDEAAEHLARAEATLAEAGGVIARREAAYRFAAARLVGAAPNPTIYRYGYLRQAHLLCYWRRQAIQAETVVTTGAAALLSDLPACLE